MVGHRKHGLVWIRVAPAQALGVPLDFHRDLLQAPAQGVNVASNL